MNAKLIKLACDLRKGKAANNCRSSPYRVSLFYNAKIRGLGWQGL